jgi:hypothetical protein
MTTGMILDVVVILLLVPTIVYAVILNRKLAALRRSREELSKVVNSFNEATMRAEAGIPKLKKATTEANHTLKDRVEKAQTLRDDLAFMIERAEELAGRLEGAVRAARAEGVVAHPAAASQQAAPNPYPSAATAPPPRTMAAGLGAAGMGAANMSEPPAPSRTPINVAAQNAMAPGALSSVTLAQTAAGFEETAADLRSALGAARAEARMSGPMAGSVAGSMSGGIGAARAKRALAPERAERAESAPGLDEERSEAERELLKALQSAR